MPAIDTKVNTGTALCVKCEAQPRRRDQRYCRQCHTQYMRDYRVKQKVKLQGERDELRRLRTVYGVTHA